MDANEKKAIEEKIKTLKGLAKSEREYAGRESCWIRRDAAIKRAEMYEAEVKSFEEDLKKN